LQKIATGHSAPPEASTSNVGKRVGIGFLIAGPIGAAIGAATGEKEGETLYPLPKPIITPKPQKQSGNPGT
jgi:hypothetical protein